MSITAVRFEAPYVVFLGDVADPIYAKTALGLVEWRPDGCAGQIRLPGCRVDAGVPELSIGHARSAGVRTLIIGSAAVGGGCPATGLPRFGMPPNPVATLRAAPIDCPPLTPYSEIHCSCLIGGHGRSHTCGRQERDGGRPCIGGARAGHRQRIAAGEQERLAVGVAARG